MSPCSNEKCAFIIKRGIWGTWVTWLVKHPTLDFCSGHDFMVSGFKPRIGLLADGAEPAWDSLSLLPLHGPPPINK